MRLNLLKKTVGQLTLAFLLIFAILGFFYQFHIKEHLVLNAEKSLNELVKSESKRISDHFDSLVRIGSQSADFMTMRLQQSIDSHSQEEFDKQFERVDGAWRSRLYSGNNTNKSGAFLSSRQPLTDSIRERLLVSAKGFDDYAQGVSSLVFNTYFISQDQFIRIFPKDWALGVEPNHDFSQDIFYSIATPSANPNRRPVWTPPYYDSIWKHWMTSIITPVYVENRFCGIIGHDVILDEIYNRILNTAYFITGYGFIFDSSKHLIIHPNFKHKLPRDAEMGLTLGSTEIPDSPLKNQLDQIIKSNKNSVPFHQMEFEENGTAYILVTQKLEILNWYFAIAVPKKEILQELPSFQTHFIFGGLAVILSLFAFSLLIVYHNIIRPIERLTQTVRGSFPGGSDFITTTVDGDEIEQLASTFNNLTQRLKQSLDNLEKDIQRREETEKSLRESKEHFRALTENSPDVIMRFNHSHHHLYVNPVVKSVINIDPEDIIGKSHRDLGFPSNLCDLWEEAIEKVFLTKKGNRIEFQLPSGIWIDWLLFPEFGPDGQVSAVVSSSRDISALKEALNSLKQSEEQFRTVVDSSKDAIIAINSDGNIVIFNKAAECMFGFSKSEMLDHTLEKLIPGHLRKSHSINIHSYFSQGRPNAAIGKVVELSAVRHSNELFPIELALSNATFGGERMVIAIIRDISERKAAEKEREMLEEQLHQSQKLEAIGKLAGGIAHDFNNLLTSISGNISLAMLDIDDSHPFYATLKEIDEAAERAAGLTRQLLAFSRKQLISPRVLNLNETVEALQKMLARLIGEDIELRVTLDKQLAKIKADKSQIEQVILNLVINARDAMLGGGVLSIVTANVELSESFCHSYPELQPGNYVRLSLKDSGTGMSPEIQSHMFEPFFTTKPQGQGTGLGLSMVYGIIQQHNGLISVTSHKNKGTTFDIYLPMVLETLSHKQRHHSRQNDPGGHETILLVEDEDMVRNVAVKALKRLGYKVFPAASAAAAIETAPTIPEGIDMLLSDVVMPRMNGRELAERLSPQFPDMKILFTSGYTEDAIAHHGVLDENVNFIAKPYTPKSLAEKVRAVLDEQD